MTSLEAALRQIHADLIEAQVSFVLVGGLAVSARRVVFTDDTATEIDTDCHYPDTGPDRSLERRDPDQAPTRGLVACTSSLVHIADSVTEELDQPSHAHGSREVCARHQDAPVDRSGSRDDHDSAVRR